jgi:hypothetical protein
MCMCAMRGPCETVPEQIAEVAWCVPLIAFLAILALTGASFLGDRGGSSMQRDCNTSVGSLNI